MHANCMVPVLCTGLLLAACGPDTGEQALRGGGAGQAGLPSEGAIASVALGDVAGATSTSGASRIDNPYAGNLKAIQAGRALFVQMNCAYCHGYDATGGMGPDLTDHYWRYYGAPADVFKSIYEGRPKGMPAWGGILPDTEIWRIVAYIQSLGGTVPPSFAGQGRQGNARGETVRGGTSKPVNTPKAKTMSEQ